MLIWNQHTPLIMVDIVSHTNNNEYPLKTLGVVLLVQTIYQRTIYNIGGPRTNDDIFSSLACNPQPNNLSCKAFWFFLKTPRLPPNYQPFAAMAFKGSNAYAFSLRVTLR